MPGIISCNEIGDSRSASDDIDYKGEATRAWRVQTDDRTYGPVSILDNAHTASPDPVALVGDQHPESTILYCKNRTCKTDGGDAEGNKFYIVTANYDNQLKEDPEERNTNPLLRPVKRRLEWGQFSKAITRDANAVQILNTIHDRFDIPFEQDDSRAILVAVRNESAANFAGLIALANDYKDAVNSDNFYGAAPGFVKMRPLATGDIQYENGVSYYTVQYEFEFHEEPAPGVEGWATQILNRGNFAYAVANDPFSRYRVKDGPKNLNEDGTVQGPNDDPYYITVKTYRRRPFGALNI